MREPTQPCVVTHDGLPQECHDCSPVLPHRLMWAVTRHNVLKQIRRRMGLTRLQQSHHTQQFPEQRATRIG
eukprot:11177326-Lingulodinium_polyedra.AAC.1